MQTNIQEGQEGDVPVALQYSSLKRSSKFGRFLSPIDPEQK